MLETRPRTSADARTGPRVGWLVPAGMLLVTLLVSALNANTFAVHVGSAGHETRGGALSAQSGQEGQPSAGDDAGHGTAGGGTHVLHVLGACLALLAAVVALTTSSFRILWDRPRPAAERSGAVRICLQAWRGPPALSPPTTSAVLRN